MTMNFLCNQIFNQDDNLFEIIVIDPLCVGLKSKESQHGKENTKK